MDELGIAESMIASESASSNTDVGSTVLRLRNRAWMLRIQSFVAIGILIVASFAIASIFMSLQRLASQPATSETPRQSPYDYGLMETRHVAISARLKEMGDLLADTRQELIADKYAKGGAAETMVIRHLQDRSDELANLKSDLDGRLAKDREDMYREILSLRAERDRALADSAEKRSYIRLVGEAVMRIGVLVLAIYLTAIVSNIAKYWLRVADHLNAVADSLDLLRGSGLSVQPAIAALTPHPIDFQVEEFPNSKSIKELLMAMTSLTKQAGRTAKMDS